MNAASHRLAQALMIGFTLAVIPGPAALAQRTLYVVKDNLAALPPFDDWTHAAPDIQTAVNAAQTGDNVLVANGWYDAGGAAAGGTLLSRVCVTNPLTVSSLNGPAHTFIVGQGPLGNQAVRGAYLADGACLSGFTLTNGHTQVWMLGDMVDDDWHGGGVCGARSALVTNCVLVGNVAYEDGGGAYGVSLDGCTLTGNTADQGGGAMDADLQNCVLTGNTAHGGGGGRDVTAVHCLIVNNTADWGGGIQFGNLRACTIISNTATMDAGGAGLDDSTMDGCLVMGNHAGRNAGGLNLNDEGVVRNSLILGNSAGATGGGIQGGADGSILNCTISGNHATRAGGVWCNDSVAIVNTIIWNNTADTAPEWEWDGSGNPVWSHCCTVPQPPGEGHLPDDPDFRNPGAGDFHLAPNSPCIDAGMWDASTADDLGGMPRPLDGNHDGIALPDCGAYEVLHPDADSDGDGMTDGREIGAGTDPCNPGSLLRITSILPTDDGIRIDWQGGTSATQLIECAPVLSADAGPWWTIMKVIPPTPTNNLLIDTEEITNSSLYYRLRVP